MTRMSGSVTPVTPSVACIRILKRIGETILDSGNEWAAPEYAPEVVELVLHDHPMEGQHLVLTIETDRSNTHVDSLAHVSMDVIRLNVRLAGPLPADIRPDASDSCR